MGTGWTEDGKGLSVEDTHPGRPGKLFLDSSGREGYVVNITVEKRHP
jgi:hypothetical protein